MKEITLQDYLIDGTQLEVADALKITQGAVYQMVRYDRDVRLILNNKGAIVKAWEKRVPSCIRRSRLGVWRCSRIGADGT